MPALTKCYPSETFGAWAQASTTVSLLTPILVLHLGITLVRFLAGEGDRARRRETFAAMAWPVVGFGGIAVLASLLVRRPLSCLIFSSPQYDLLAVMTVVWAAQEAIFTYLMCYQQASRRMRRIAIFQTTQAAARAALIMALAVARYDLKWVLGSVIGVGLLWSAAALALAVRELGVPLPTIKRLRQYLAFSLPNMPHWILSWSIVGGSRYLLTHLMSLSDAGVFSASWSLTNLLLLFSAPIAMVLYPSLTEAWEQGQLSRVRSYFLYSTKLFLALGIPAAVGLCLLSQQLLGLIATAEYAVGTGLVCLMAVATVLVGVQQINIHVVYLVKQTKWIPLFTGVVAATNVGLCVYLIPSIGVAGAAIAVLVSYFMLALILTVWVGRMVGSTLDIRFLWKVVLASLAMAVCVRYTAIRGSVGVVLAIIIGVVVYALMLLLLKAFSEQDKALARSALMG